MKNTSNLAIIPLLLFLVACGSASIKTKHFSTLDESSTKVIDEVVIIPVKIVVKESGIGTLEKLPERSLLATKIVQEELENVLKELNVKRIIKLEANSDEEIEKLDEYIGLYERVASSAQFTMTAGKAWKHKTEKGADYTLGEDIQFVKDKTGVNRAIFVYGEDIVTSAGKKALAVLAIMGGFGVNPGGIAVLHLGIVNLNDGSLLWSNTIANQSMSLDNKKSVRSAILETLQESPFTVKKIN